MAYFAIGMSKAHFYRDNSYYIDWYSFWVTNLPEGFTIISKPQSISPTFFQFDFASLWDFDLIVVTLILVFMDLFNTIGTLVGAANQAGMVTKEGNIPHMKEALLSDAVGTCIGAVCGTSTLRLSWKVRQELPKADVRELHL